MGFKALHGEVSICVWFAVTPCVISTCWVDYYLKRTWAEGIENWLGLLL